MLKEGMFIQGRYEIVGKIGTGGMADVYKARDHKLNRFVAVKVLKAEFRNDRAFITKFRAEAQAAAGLAHPNIVNIYDVGDEKGISFIIMELVEGITLKEYIAKKGRLAVREATSIAIQVSQGLEAAHNSGIIHRDVKPQNIIISTDGKVKVTDFGIARAATANTISTAVMGSVHYSSPEQARGGYSDAKSDIYSLGITMYEMLTGRVPFDGDTTVAIAIKHLQEEMKSPEVYVPGLPKSTVQIIFKCTQKSPDRRYANMAGLIRDLKESLVNPDGDFVQILSAGATGKTVVISREELGAIKEGSAARSASDGSYVPQGAETPGMPQGQEPYGGAAYGGGYGGPGGYGPGNPGYENGGAYGGGTYGSGQGYGNGQGYNGGYGTEAPYEPYTYGMDSRAYGSRGYNYQDNMGEKRRSYQDEEEDGKGILSPKLEKLMTVGSIIIAILIAFIFLGLIANALGIFRFSLPGLLTGNSSQTTEQTTESTAGISQSQTTATLSDDGNTVTQEETDPVVTVETQAETIQAETETESETEPATETESETEAIHIEEAGTVTIPDVTGMDYDTAYDSLMSSGFYVSRQDDPSDTVEAGIVMEQSMTGNAKAGSTVILIVSSGPESTDEEGTWMCNASLEAPSGYNGQLVQLVLEQGSVTTTILEGVSITFPYDLNVQGVSGESSGTVYLYVYNEVTGVYDLLATYYDVPFSEVQ